MYSGLSSRFGDLTDFDGRLSSRLPTVSGIWRPSNVNLKDNYVCFDVPESDLGLSPDQWGWVRVEPSTYLLDAFVRLRTPKQIVNFAGRFGPLYLCATHRDPYDLWYPSAPECKWLPYEPVSWWLWHIEKVRATLSAAALLHEGKPVPSDTWQAMGWPADIATGDDEDHWLSRFWLAGTINGWIAQEKGTPRLMLNEDLRITLDAGFGVLRAIWLLVAQTVAREKAIFACAGCGNLHTRPVGVRVPKTGEKAYCPDCRKDYAPAKKLSAAKRRNQLKALVSFVDSHQGLSWSKLRLLWNEEYPDWHYTSDTDIETDYTTRAKSYGVRRITNG